MKDYKIQMKFFTFIIVMLSIVMLPGCEKQAEPEPSPIEKVLPMPDPENPQFSQPCQEDSDYECGVILVQYDEETWAEQIFPVPAVNTFLVEKGYKPEVTNIFDFIRTEVIYIGEFDVLPIIKELVNVPGVEHAEPNYFVSIDNPALEGN